VDPNGPGFFFYLRCESPPAPVVDRIIELFGNDQVVPVPEHKSAFLEPLGVLVLAGGHPASGIMVIFADGEVERHTFSDAEGKAVMKEFPVSDAPLSHRVTAYPAGFPARNVRFRYGAVPAYNDWKRVVWFIAEELAKGRNPFRMEKTEKSAFNAQEFPVVSSLEILPFGFEPETGSVAVTYAFARGAWGRPLPNLPITFTLVADPGPSSDSQVLDSWSRTDDRGLAKITLRTESRFPERLIITRRGASPTQGRRHRIIAVAPLITKDYYFVAVPSFNLPDKIKIIE
jgi:hypothetical protein